MILSVIEKLKICKLGVYWGSIDSSVLAETEEDRHRFPVWTVAVFSVASVHDDWELRNDGDAVGRGGWTQQP